MSLFGSLIADMENDPIFGAHSRAMNQMNRMMDSMLGGGGGFGRIGGDTGMFGGPMFGLGHGMVHQDLMPFGGGIMSPFGGIAGMGGFPNFNALMQHDGNAHSFSSMSVTSMTLGPDGRPQVYQASNQTAAGPGGVRETRKAVADSRTGTRRIAVGRQLGDRGHIREREENMFTGQREENEEFINIDEEQGQEFDHEWKERAYGGRYSSSMPAIMSRHEGQSRRGSRNARQQTGYPTRTSVSSPTVTIEELPPSDDEGNNRDAPKSTTPTSFRHSPYTRDKKQKQKRVKKC